LNVLQQVIKAAASSSSALVTSARWLSNSRRYVISGSAIIVPALHLDRGDIVEFAGGHENDLSFKSAVEAQMNDAGLGGLQLDPDVVSPSAPVDIAGV
jgi:hypothetical protein